MRLRRANTLIAGIGLILILSAIVVNTSAAPATDDASKRVKIVGGGVELIELTPSAPQCGKQKGETIRLKVTSETPVDVRLYIQTGYKQWMDKDFPNQKRGDEITSFRCDPKPNYKIYTHAAGSSEAWPKP
jgi:hypothetical protein